MDEPIRWYTVPTPPGNRDAIHKYLAGAVSPGRARDYVYQVLGDRIVLCTQAQLKNFKLITQVSVSEIPENGGLSGIVCPRHAIVRDRDIAVWAVKTGRRAGFALVGNILVEGANPLQGANPLHGGMPLRIHADRPGRAVNVQSWRVDLRYRALDPHRFAHLLVAGSGRFKAFGLGCLLPDFVFAALKTEAA